MSNNFLQATLSNDQLTNRKIVQSYKN